jgi:hypothetical protein
MATDKTVRILARQTLLRWHEVDLSQFTTAEILAVPLRRIQQFIGYAVTDEILTRSDYTAGQLVMWADEAVHYSSQRCMKRAARSLEDLTANQIVVLLLNGPWIGLERTAQRGTKRLVNLLQECSDKQMVSLILDIGKRDRHTIRKHDTCRPVLQKWLTNKPTFDDLVDILPALDFICATESEKRVYRHLGGLHIEDIVGEFVRKRIPAPDIATGIGRLKKLDPRYSNLERPVTSVVRDTVVSELAQQCNATLQLEERLCEVAEVDDDQLWELTFGGRVAGDVDDAVIRRSFVSEDHGEDPMRPQYKERISTLQKLANIK